MEVFEMTGSSRRILAIRFAVGVLTRNGLYPLVRLNMPLTGDSYMELLCDHLHAFTDSMYPNNDGFFPEEECTLSFGPSLTELVRRSILETSDNGHHSRPKWDQSGVYGTTEEAHSCSRFCTHKYKEYLISTLFFVSANIFLFFYIAFWRYLSLFSVVYY